MSAEDDLLELVRAAHNPVKSTAEPAETDEVLRLSRKRKRDDESSNLKAKLREELLRKQAQAKESDPKGLWLRNFVHNAWKNTKKDSFAFERKRRLCYNLLRKAKANNTDHGAAAAAPVGTANGENDKKKLNVSVPRLRSILITKSTPSTRSTPTTRRATLITRTRSSSPRERVRETSSTRWRWWRAAA